MQAKDMPYEERLRRVRGYVALEEAVLFPLVREKLGENAVQELRGVREGGSRKLAADASIKDRFEQEHGDWINAWSSSYDFIKSRLGDSGIREFENDDIEALKRTNAGAALSVYRLVRAVSRKRAFMMLRGQLAYGFQPITLFTITDATHDCLTLDTSSCQVLDSPGGERFCQAFCGIILPRWMKDQFHVTCETRRRGKSCSLTLAPE